MTRRVVSVLSIVSLVAGLVVLSGALPSDAGVGSAPRVLAASCDGEDSTLYELPTTPGSAAIPLGPIDGDEVDCPAGLAYVDGVLYGVDYETNAFYSIPLTGGEVTVIDTLDSKGTTGPCGLTWNEADGTFWVVSYETGGLFSLGLDGSITFINGLEFAACGLGFDPVSGLLYSFDYETGDLYSIDPDSGEPTLVGPSGLESPCAAEWDTDAGRLLASEEEEDTSLFIVSTTAGGTTVDLNITGISDICGLAYIPAVEPPPTTEPPTTTTTTSAAAQPATQPRFTG
jgi:hypothetical protein